jgi:hypothetical protein
VRLSHSSVLSTTGHKHCKAKPDKTRQALDSTTANAMLPSGKKKFLFGEKNASIAV